MASLFIKFQEAVKTLAKSPTFAKDPRQLQLEADINRVFLYTSYNRLGKDADETDAEEIIDMAGKATVVEQQKQVQENIHCQIKSFCMSMDEVLLSDVRKTEEPQDSEKNAGAHRSGLSFAVGKSDPSAALPTRPDTKPVKKSELSDRIKDLIGYTVDVKKSQLTHPEAGRGLFLRGEANVGAVIAIYPGVVYSPAYYRYIPGYPRVDARNSYLITRYDGTVINSQPWGLGGETREVWDGSTVEELMPIKEAPEKGSDRLWKMLSKPQQSPRVGNTGEDLERRNPLAFAHFANHPDKGMDPNVMVCPYDFPLTEKDMRPYIPNVPFGDAEEVNMRKFGSLWFRSGSSRSRELDIPSLKTIILVATRALCDEEILLNYRLSNSKRRPSWYNPVDEEEDRRRWS